MTAYEPLHKVPSIAEQEGRFINAMLSARRAGLEHFILGICTEPCTERPVFIAAQSPLLGRAYGQPSVMCADLARFEPDAIPVKHRRRRRRRRVSG